MSLVNLASLLDAQGRAPEGLVTIQRAAHLLEESFGESDDRTKVAQSWMAHLERKVGNPHK